MPEFRVEIHVSRTEDAAVKRGAAKARRAAQKLTREGTPVRGRHFRRSDGLPSLKQLVGFIPSALRKQVSGAQCCDP